MCSYYPGRRLSLNDELCTVRYCGPLPTQEGDWLGVEWDDPNRGKHDGQYKGRRLFSTSSTSPSSASFIRPARMADRSRTFLEALRYKYAGDGVQQTPSATEQTIEISGKVVQEIGFERIREQQAVLFDLKIVVLDGLQICGADHGADISKLQEEIANTCPKIVELDLSRNLFEHWKDISVICSPLTNLRSLKAR
jgi:tubulin-specific chaperone E